MPSDAQYLYTDLFIISSLFITISLTEAADTLSPAMPSATLFNF